VIHSNFSKLAEFFDYHLSDNFHLRSQSEAGIFSPISDGRSTDDVDIQSLSVSTVTICCSKVLSIMLIAYIEISGKFS
jgi:hypothetical protein